MRGVRSGGFHLCDVPALFCREIHALDRRRPAAGDEYTHRDGKLFARDHGFAISERVDLDPGREFDRTKEFVAFRHRERPKMRICG